MRAFVLNALRKRGSTLDDDLVDLPHRVARSKGRERRNDNNYSCYKAQLKGD
jgi:hypothetical protein